MSFKRFWKVVASGIGFGSLGVLGVIFSLLGVPLLNLLPGGKAALRQRTRSLFFLYFRNLVRFLSWAGIFTLTQRDMPPREGMDGHLILSTHPGYLDVVLLLGTVPDLTCIVKPAIWKNPLFGWAVRSAGYISADDPETVLQRSAKALARGEVLVLYPEGTRTLPGSPYRFQRGAAHLALRSGAPILPLLVSCEPPLLAKGHRWYHMPEEPCDYQFRALAPIRPEPVPADLPEPLAARRITDWLEAQFNKEVYGSGHLSPGDQAVHRDHP